MARGNRRIIAEHQKAGSAAVKVDQVARIFPELHAGWWSASFSQRTKNTICCRYIDLALISLAVDVLQCTYVHTCVDRAITSGIVQQLRRPLKKKDCLLQYPHRGFLRMYQLGFLQLFACGVSLVRCVGRRRPPVCYPQRVGIACARSYKRESVSYLSYIFLVCGKCRE